jgi:hypothetical protein
MYPGDTAGSLTKLSVTKKLFLPWEMEASLPISLAMLLIFALRMLEENFGIASSGAKTGGGQEAEPFV